MAVVSHSLLVTSAQRRWLISVLVIALVFAVVPGCGPVERSHNIRHVVNYYYVHRGDTLYTIAWRFNLDVRDVMAWNRLKPPYTIYPGQRLVMSPPPGYRRVVVTKPSGPKPVAVSRSPVAPPQRSGSPSAPVQQQPQVAAKTRASAPTVTDVARNGSSRASASIARRQPPRPAKSRVGKESSPRKLSWRWPLQGRLVQRYNAAIPGHQGIHIQGRNGQAVRAVEVGTVVYSGNGLKGYRELIIIQHSPDFLSAYAQNRKRLVIEGEKVSRGQKIAELGDPHSNVPELHFELRLHGKPVDPLLYLGAR